MIRMFAKKKKVADKNLVSNKCDLQVFEAAANLQPSTFKLTSQEESGMYTKISSKFSKILARKNKYTQKVLRLRYASSLWVENVKNYHKFKY